MPIALPLTLGSMLEAVAAIGSACSLFFYLLSGISIRGFLTERSKTFAQPSEDALPPVSILKPLKGIDPEIWENLCSHCEQDYQEFQLIFGVNDPSDPAIEVVRKLQAKYSNLAIELIVCNRILGANIKVSNLAQMLPAARHEIILVNDSDIRVPKDYLRTVIPPLADDSVGLVTCLYRGVSAPTPGSRLEALGISTDFVPGVLSAKFLEKGLHFGLGSTLAFRRRNLAEIGGFEAILDYLADDYEIGRRIAGNRKTNSAQLDDRHHFPARLHVVGVFPASTALVAHHSRRTPLGICRTSFHLWSALGLADAAGCEWRPMGRDTARRNSHNATDGWVCNSPGGAARSAIVPQYFLASRARPNRPLHLARRFYGKPHSLAGRHI